MIESLPPTTGDPVHALRSRGLRPSQWSAGPGAVFAPHRHPHTKRLYVLRGSISFDGMDVRAGEGILVPAGWEHSALAGEDGVECVEAFEDEGRS